MVLYFESLYMVGFLFLFFVVVVFLCLFLSQMKVYEKKFVNKFYANLSTNIFLQVYAPVRFTSQIRVSTCL